MAVNFRLQLMECNGTNGRTLDNHPYTKFGNPDFSVGVRTLPQLGGQFDFAFYPDHAKDQEFLETLEAKGPDGMSTGNTAQIKKGEIVEKTEGFMRIRFETENSVYELTGRETLDIPVDAPVN